MTNLPSVEKVVAEFVKEFNDPKWGYVEAGVDDPWETEIVTDWLRTTLEARDLAHREKMRKVFVELLQTDRTIYVYKSNIEEIAAKHNIDISSNNPSV